MAYIEITTMVGCPLMCTACPQDQLMAAYGKVSDKYMSLDTFGAILDKIPSHVRIDFAGMSEPWVNPDATKMLEIALHRGRRVAVYTTLYGMTVDDSLRITTELLPKYKEQVGVICLHLPDDNMNMRGYKGSDEYRQVLKNFLNMIKAGLFPARKFQCMTMDKSGRVHRDLKDIMPNLGNWTGISRAGSLSKEQIEKSGVKPPPQNDFELVCASTPFYDQNVVLPNGDVVLCCMDYSMKHIIGNLLKSGYWDLFASQELARVRVENQKPEFSKCTICKSCDNVWKIRMDPDDERWIHSDAIGKTDVLVWFKEKVTSRIARWFPVRHIL
jgi:hypothetical protein